MRKSSKLIVLVGAIAALAVPSAAMASEPTGTPVINPGSDYTSLEEAGASKDAAVASGENMVGWGSSVLIQNGQFVSGKASGAADWQHQKGSRSAQVQAELALTGLGSLAK